MSEAIDLPTCLAHLQRRALAVGAVAGLLAAIGAAVWPLWFFPAYLVGFLFWWGLSLGSLAVSMLHNLTGGNWGVPIRRVLESAAATLPLMAILFLPIPLFGLRYLYPWADPDKAGEHAVAVKAAYLNVEAFDLRAIIYFTIWIGLMLILNGLAAGRHPGAERVRRRRMQLLSGPGLGLYGLSLTFAAVDWSMSLEPEFSSSMYGVLFIGAQGVSTISFSVLTIILLGGYEPWLRSATTDRRHDLGNLLLTFVMFSTYVSFMQFLIIWSGNLPEDNFWYVHRSQGGWQTLPIMLFGFHFVVPFLLLLSRATKRSRRHLAAVATALLVMRLVDLFWLVAPAFSPQRLTLNPLTFLAPVAIGGLWLAVFGRQLSRRVLLPTIELEPEEASDEQVSPSRV